MPVDTLKPCRVLIVEDEMLVLLLMEEMLQELGCTVASASTVSGALRMLGSETFDGATLDVNLRGTTSYPVADVLTAHNIPFLFASGYAQHLKDGYQHIPRLQKPFRFEDLAIAMRGLLASRHASDAADGLGGITNPTPLESTAAVAVDPDKTR